MIRTLGFSTLLCLLVVAFMTYYYKCGSGKKEVSVYKKEQIMKKDLKVETNIKNLKQDTVYILNISGISHYQKDAVSAKEKQLITFYEAELNEAKKQAKLAKNKLDNYEKLSLSVKGNIVANIDGSNRNDKGYYEIPFSDCFLDGTAILNDSVTTMYLQYTGTLKLKDVRYWKRKHHFLFIKWGDIIFKDDITTNCNNIKVDSVLDLRIEKMN